MSIVDLPLTLISSLLYPEKEIISTVSLKANKEKSPFISEIVPVVVSLVRLVAYRIYVFDQCIQLLLLVVCAVSSY